MVIRNAFSQAYKNKNYEAMQRAYEAAERIMNDADDLLCAKPEFSFYHWLSDARKWGNEDNGLCNYYETQARTLLTVWGGPVLNDYANRLWGGLLSDYYWRIRWQVFMQGAMNAVRAGVDFDEDAFKQELSEREQAYACHTWTVSHVSEPENVLKEARKILHRIENGYYSPDK